MSFGEENGGCKDQTAPATHAAANEQRWTKAQKKHLWLLNYSTNKKEEEVGMYCWVQLLGML